MITFCYLLVLFLLLLGYRELANTVVNVMETAYKMVMAFLGQTLICFWFGLNI